jgi:hypothetical protein
MPTLSVFIRKDDVEKWKALPNKSEFLHNALKRQPDAYLLSPKLAKENPGLVRDFDKQARFQKLQQDNDVRYEPPEPIA